MSKNQKILDQMQEEILHSNIPEQEKNKFMRNFMKLRENKINLMITGATGCGKSSTINALFNTEVAKVGVGVDPETMSITRYNLDNLILWDTPGLGDGKEKDQQHSKNIIKKLNELDDNNKPLIDLVLVILDGSSRDLGTSYELINKVIIPNIGKEASKRILVAINQADMAMKGKNWDYKKNCPNATLEKFLNEKAESVKKRIKEGTGVDIEPIYYSAGYKEEDADQMPPYNLSKLLYYIVKNTPKEKRLAYVDNINKKENNWKHDDGQRNYRSETKKSFMDTVVDFVGGVASAVGDALGTIGRIFTGGCYITTATCEEFNKPDNCFELTELRKFRDNWLLKQSDGPQLIQEYYLTAPRIVDVINSQSNRKQIYRYIQDDYLTPCLEYIRNQENEKCKQLYIQMVRTLEQKYLKENH